MPITRIGKKAVNVGSGSGILGVRRRVRTLAMPARRLEDRIRELCARALYEKEPQWGVTIVELQMALQEHTLRIANLSAGAIGAGKPLLTERRQA